MSKYVGSIQNWIATRVPWWLQGPNATAFLQAFGITMDTLAATTMYTMKQRRPFECAPENLPILSGERGIRLYDTEPLPSKRKRVAQWRQIKRHTGNHCGQMINLQPFFLPGDLPRIRFVFQDGAGACATWQTLNPDGSYEVHHARPSNWNFDGATAQWSRAWCIIYLPGTQYDTGATKYGDGHKYTSGAQKYGGNGITAARAADMIACLNEASAPHYILWGLIFTTDPASFDPTSTAVTYSDGSTSLPTGNWGNIIDPTTHKRTRPAYARFYFDLGHG